jgi:hypothetical protein
VYVGARIIESVPKRRTSFFLEPEMGDGLKALKARDGVPEGEAIRRAVAEYLKKRGIVVKHKADRKRVSARKRS